MDSLRETGKLLIVLGVALAGLGALLTYGGKIAVSAGAFAGRYCVSGAEWKFLFPGGDVHFVECGVEFADVGCESFSKMNGKNVLQGLEPLGFRRRLRRG